MQKIKKILGEQYLPFKVLTVLVLSIVLILYFISCSRKGGDFVTFLEAAAKMWEGKNIYAPPYVNLRYSYSPFWAMILVPFALLPAGVGAFIWLIISLILLVRTIWLLKNHFGVRGGSVKADRILWFIILLYVSRYVELNFHHVQMTIFLVWLILEASVQLFSEGELVAGVLVGIGSIIKIMPVVIIPYFFYRRKFFAAFSAIFTMILCFFIPIIFTGRQLFEEMNRSWYSILRPDSPEFQSDATWHLPQNLSTLMYRLLVHTGAPHSYPVLDLSYSAATNIIWITIGCLIVLTLYFLGTRPFAHVSRLHQLYEISYIMLLIPLIFPHQMKYAFYFVLPAICCVAMVLVDTFYTAKLGINYKLTATLFLLSFLLCTATTDLILGMDLSTITQHYKTITIGTLLLIPALALNRAWFLAQE